MNLTTDRKALVFFYNLGRGSHFRSLRQKLLCPDYHVVPGFATCLAVWERFQDGSPLTAL
jgi:hypothetical protein